MLRLPNDEVVHVKIPIQLVQVAPPNMSKGEGPKMDSFEVLTLREEMKRSPLVALREVGGMFYIDNALGTPLRQEDCPTYNNTRSQHVSFIFNCLCWDYFDCFDCFDCFVSIVSIVSLVSIVCRHCPPCTIHLIE